MNPALPLAAVGGLIAGLVFFGALAWSVERMLAGRLLAGLGVQILRFLALAGALMLAARAGAGPLTAMALGVLAARWLWTSRLRRGA